MNQKEKAAALDRLTKLFNEGKLVEVSKREKLVQLPRIYWRMILNLLTEELEIWEPTSPDYKQIRAMIFQIEKQTGISKKPHSEVEKELRE